MIRRRSEDELVVGSANIYAESDAWAMDPPDLEPVFEAYIEGEHFVIQAADDHAQSIAAKHPVEIGQ